MSMMTHSRMAAVAALTFTGVLLLTGCAQAGGDSSEAAPPVSSPPAETTKAISAPSSRWDITCDDLIENSVFSASESGLSVVGTPSAVHPSVIPDEYVIRTVGGISCTWSDGNGTDMPGAEWLRVEAIPNAAEQWAHPAHVPTPVPACGDGCFAHILTTDSEWISVSSGGSVIPAQEFAAFVQEVEERLSVAGANDVTPPTQLLGESCDAAVDIEAIRDALGTKTVLAFVDGGGGWSIASAAKSLAGLPGIPACNISAAADEYAAYGGITWLQQAEWAFSDADVSDGERFELPGAQTDSGFITCGDPVSCSASFLLDGHWVIASANELDPTASLAEAQPSALSPRDAAIAIARLVVG